ncbi:hypothetical protein COO60DRAFT_1619096 [Scenedesmus sp. NREL 46B-D3]|nr:hypothetical protein COO60DRAFT_1619096 [Scenedesmus sp. NREL 46B-D3]
MTTFCLAGCVPASHPTYCPYFQLVHLVSGNAGCHTGESWQHQCCSSCCSHVLPFCRFLSITCQPPLTAIKQLLLGAAACIACQHCCRHLFFCDLGLHARLKRCQVWPQRSALVVALHRVCNAHRLAIGVDISANRWWQLSTTVTLLVRRSAAVRLQHAKILLLLPRPLSLLRGAAILRWLPHSLLHISSILVRAFG